MMQASNRVCTRYVAAWAGESKHEREVSAMHMRALGVCAKITQVHSDILQKVGLARMLLKPLTPCPFGVSASVPVCCLGQHWAHH